MLDEITILAIKDAVIVPNAEDFLLEEKQAPSRYNQVKAFEAW
jgi:hypothetical protein